MKKIIFLLLMYSTYGYCNAQNFDEWFRQKKTRIKYLVQQISALQAYIDIADKGYRFSEGKVFGIKAIKSGEFSLHSAFFGSLKLVNPEITNKPEVGEIMDKQASMIRQMARNVMTYKESPWIQPHELDYVTHVYASLADILEKNMEELVALTTIDTFEMTDADRILRIGALYKEMDEQSAFLQNFSDKTNLVLAERHQESLDNEETKNLYKNKK